MAERLIRAARALSEGVARLRFGAPVTHVYNPLDYAQRSHALYLRKYANSRKRVVFLGMNPGPFGMAQTGVPFGEIRAVRDFLGVEAPVERPAHEHPKRPVEGFACTRSEVSGQRLWGAIQARYSTAEAFFAEHFVANYCPLVFMEGTGRNRTPDKLPPVEREPLYACCDDHLRAVVEVLRPELVIGVGKFAERRAAAALAGGRVRVGSILHPSPASPKANAGWAGLADRQLRALGLSGLL